MYHEKKMGSKADQRYNRISGVTASVITAFYCSVLYYVVTKVPTCVLYYVVTKVPTCVLYYVVTKVPTMYYTVETESEEDLPKFSKSKFKNPASRGPAY